MTRSLLDKCDWQDKTLWVARHLLGGQAVNGFLKSTASVQRIKKQRARQVGFNKKGKDDASEASGAKKEDPIAAAAASSVAAGGANKKRDTASEQETEEDIKRQIMNVRTAKKLKSELDVGVEFCVLMHDTIQSILLNLDVGVQAPSLTETSIDLSTTAYQMHGATISTTATIPSSSSSSSVNHGSSAASISVSAGAVPVATSTSFSTKPSAPILPSSSSLQKQTSVSSLVSKEPEPQSPPEPSTASAGNASGSTLRKSRKKKLPPCTEPPINLPEFDTNGRRIHSKKDHLMRLCEATRFRALKVGDFVAARVTSRDLWILAKVQRDYPGPTLSPVDLLALSEAKREQLFRGQVRGGSDNGLTPSSTASTTIFLRGSRLVSSV
jgi:hypothetical protein